MGAETVSVERKVKRSFFNKSRPGRFHKVRHLPDQPERVEFEIGQTWREGQTLRWVALAFGLGALAVVWRTALPAVNAVRARKYGTLRWAKVLKIEHVGPPPQVVRLWRGRGPQTKFKMVFATEDRILGNSFPAGDSRRFRDYAIGSDVEVYLGLNRRLYWIGDVGPGGSVSTVPRIGKPKP